MSEVTIQPCDLIFVHGHKFVDEVIEYVSHSPYSHVAGVVKPGELIEAQGFRRTGYEDIGHYAGQADVYRCDTLTDVQRVKIIDYVTREVGSQYDYLLLGWEAVRYAFHVLLPYREPFHTRICSTLWRDAFLAADIDLCPGIEYPSPSDLSMSERLRKIGPLA